MNEYDVIEWLAVNFSPGDDSWQVLESLEEALDVGTENCRLRLQIVFNW
jgi:hypothetical protein